MINYQIRSNMRDTLRMSMADNDTGAILMKKLYPVSHFCCRGNTYEQNMVNVMNAIEADVNQITQNRYDVKEDSLKIMYNAIMRKCSVMVKFWTDIMG